MPGVYQAGPQVVLTRQGEGIFCDFLRFFVKYSVSQLSKYASSKHDEGMENILFFSNFPKIFEKSAENGCAPPKCRNFGPRAEISAENSVGDFR